MSDRGCRPGERAGPLGASGTPLACTLTTAPLRPGRHAATLDRARAALDAIKEAGFKIVRASSATLRRVA